MSAVTAVEPDVLDEFVRAEGTFSERQRRALLQVQRAIDGLGPSRQEVGPVVAGLPLDIRRVLARAEALAERVAATAAAFRTADDLLHRLGGSSGQPGSGDAGARERGTILPVPDVSIEWRWPADWTITRRWGDREANAEVELGAGARSETGAGVDVTREAIRVGAFEEARLGLWAIAAIGSALGPFAARASGELFVGARGGAEALLHIGRDGARAHVGGEVFAGAKAEGDVRGTFGPVQAGAEGSVGYGIGTTGVADIDLSLQRIGGRVKIGAALGLGLEGGFEYYLEPAWLADGLLDLRDGAVAVGSAAFDTGRRVLDGTVAAGASAVTAAAGAGQHAIGGAVDVGSDVVGGALGAGGSAARTIGGWLR